MKIVKNVKILQSLPPTTKNLHSTSLAMAVMGFSQFRKKISFELFTKTEGGRLICFMVNLIFS